MRRITTPLIQAIFLGIVIIGAAMLYWPAISGTLYFDDKQNLNGLTAVMNFDSALYFIFTGDAGPLGRPLALASFALQAYAWPGNPEVFLRSNILLHLLNGVLLAWCLLRLEQLRGVTAQQANWTTIASTALWLAIPLLASSSLFIVQRMATLSGTFMLLGLLGYLSARSKLASHPHPALLGMSLSLGTGTLLAVLTKENGSLLPVLVLAIETTLLRAQLFKTSPATRAWGWLCLVLPLAIILAYMATRIPYSEQMTLRREFTAEQRLWTQAEILWQYLLHAFVPTPSELTPFHDQLKASPSLFHASTLLAIGAWAILVGISLYFRHRVALLNFAISWYLGAHLLESTVLNLELYFAHRNYLALIGPVYALVSGLMAIEGPPGKTARTLLVGYILALALSLYNFTTLWGQPALAAEMWTIHKPDSTRAKQNLATQLHQNRWHHAALRVLDETYESDPQRRIGVGFQSLTLACAIEPDTNQAERTAALLDQLETARPDYGLAQKLLELQRLLQKSPCTGITLRTIEKLTLKALEAPGYANSRGLRHNLYAVLTESAIAQQDFGKTMLYIEESMRIMPSLEGLHLALQVLADAGRPDLGQAFIDQTRANMPKHPIQRLNWTQQLDLLELQLAEINADRQAKNLQDMP